MTSGQSKINIGLVKMRSNQSLLDGLTGKTNFVCDNNMIEMELTEDAPQADLDKGDHIFVPLVSITFLQKLKRNI